MHRSGTSLVAQGFADAGWTLGRDLLPPSEYNPHGYFEARSIMGFHDAVLAAMGTAWWDLPGLLSRDMAPSASWDVRARRVLADEFDESPGRWGFKDPRASLFLDFWGRVLPNAHFVFVVRHPVEVTVSLLRRGDPLGVSDPRPRSRAVVALGLWRLYNERIVRFLRAQRHRCSVVRVPDDVVDPTPARSHLPAALRQVDWSAVFEPALLRHFCPRWLRDMVADLAIVGLHRELHRLGVPD
jgi:hypothetical protein